MVWFAASAFLLSLLSSFIKCEGSRLANHTSAIKSKYSQHLRGTSDVTPRIIGGQNAIRGRYPYIVTLVDSTGTLYCGGTLIAPDVVLTASHCLRYVHNNLVWMVANRPLLTFQFLVCLFFMYVLFQG